MTAKKKEQRETNRFLCDPQGTTRQRGQVSNIQLPPYIFISMRIERERDSDPFRVMMKHVRPRWSEEEKKKKTTGRTDDPAPS